jgi:hypothetical protein
VQVSLVFGGLAFERFMIFPAKWRTVLDSHVESSSHHGRVGSDEAVSNGLRSSASTPQSSEQAQASVVLGAVFALVAVPTLHLIHVLWSSGFHGFGRLAEGAAAVVGFLIGVFVLVSLVIGFVFGIMGLMTAKRQARTIALPLAGALLNFFAFWGWVGIMICWTVAVVGRP